MNPILLAIAIVTVVVAAASLAAAVYLDADNPKARNRRR